MIRRFNYTGRKRIDRQRFAIQLHEPKDAPLSFSMTGPDLSGLALPDGAKVMVEATRGTAAMRFPWGTVANIAPPGVQALTLVPVNPSFRVKVVASDDSGRLLALSPDVTPGRGDPGDGGGARDSLLWLDEGDLGKEVWRLAFDIASGAHPTLTVNKNIPEMSDIALRDGAFRGLVLPQAMRDVLAHALFVAEADLDDYEGEWGGWFGLASSLHPEQAPPHDDRGEQSRWIDDVVAAFASQRFDAKEQFILSRRQP